MNGVAETKRLKEARDQKAAWRKWGPYLSERQWGTVGEDYSDNGDAWDYFPMNKRVHVPTDGENPDPPCPLCLRRTWRK